MENRPKHILIHDNYFKPVIKKKKYIKGNQRKQKLVLYRRTNIRLTDYLEQCKRQGRIVTLSKYYRKKKSAFHFIPTFLKTKAK